MRDLNKHRKSLFIFLLVITQKWPEVRGHPRRLHTCVHFWFWGCCFRRGLAKAHRFPSKESLNAMARSDISDNSVASNSVASVGEKFLDCFNMTTNGHKRVWCLARHRALTSTQCDASPPGRTGSQNKGYCN